MNDHTRKLEELRRQIEEQDTELRELTARAQDLAERGVTVPVGSFFTDLDVVVENATTRPQSTAPIHYGQRA